MPQREPIQPIVLVGGKSRRFGRDKLVEPVSGELLVQRPIQALRAVFGARVALVGGCAPQVAQLGDLVIPDHYPGRGPIGGILSALEFRAADSAQPSSVFVLSGDLLNADPALVRAVVDRAAAVPSAAAVLAHTTRGTEPCIGIYRQSCVNVLRDSIATDTIASPPLRALLQRLIVEAVVIDDLKAMNINRPGDLDA